MCVALQVVHDANGATTVSDLTLIDVNTPQVRLCMGEILHLFCSGVCAMRPHVSLCLLCDTVCFSTTYSTKAPSPR